MFQSPVFQRARLSADARQTHGTEVNTPTRHGTASDLPRKGRLQIDLLRERARLIFINREILMRTMILACVMIVAAGSVLAQNAPPPPEEAPPPGGSSTMQPGGSMQPSRAPEATRSAKAMACRKQQQAQGVRGQDLQDAVQVCVAEAHLDCLKQAIAAKARGPQRRSFIETCMNQTPN
jgi:hypothetical protein